MLRYLAEKLWGLQNWFLRDRGVDFFLQNGLLFFFCLICFFLVTI